MNAIEMLMQEHRTIEQVLEALVGFADETVRSGRGDRQELARFVTFLREFADARHHAKEEDVLFRAMVQAGFPSEGGPIAVMLHEHGLGRAHVAALAELAGKGTPWSAVDLSRLGAAAHGYAALLRAHIQKEDGVLYPMALRHLPEAALEQVNEACRMLDTARTASAGPDLLALAEALDAAHGPAHRTGTSRAAAR
jgi:hemerythrin-like domain-containing protein